MKLFEKLDLRASPHSDRCRRPLAYSVERENRSFIEGRRKKCARRMRLMMFRVQQPTLVSAESVANCLVGIELVLDPERTCFEKRFESARSNAEVRLENALELEQWLVVERDRGESSVEVRASEKQYSIAREGNESSPFSRVNRSSCAAATISPSPR